MIGGRRNDRIIHCVGADIVVDCVCPGLPFLVSNRKRGKVGLPRLATLG